MVLRRHSCNQDQQHDAGHRRQRQHRERLRLRAARSRLRAARYGGPVGRLALPSAQRGGGPPNGVDPGCKRQNQQCRGQPGELLANKADAGFEALKRTQTSEQAVTGVFEGAELMIHQPERVRHQGQQRRGRGKGKMRPEPRLALHAG